MILRRNPETTPEQQLNDYVTLFNGAHALDPADVDTLNKKWDRINSLPWYEAAAEHALDLAVKHGRLDQQNRITGALADPDQAHIDSLRDIVTGGGAIDVALAVLVRDLLEPRTYRRLTDWWSKPPSTWLPGDDPAPDPERHDPAPRPADVAAGPDRPLPVPLRRAAGDPAAHGAEVTTELPPWKPPWAPGADPIPSPPPRPRSGTKPMPPVQVPRNQILDAAARKAMARQAALRRSRWSSIRGVAILFFGVGISVYALGDQLGAQLLPPASLLGFGHGQGRLWCSLFWIAMTAVSAMFAVRQFKDAQTLRIGK